MRLLVVNMKAYENAFGPGARELAREASRVEGVRVILAAPALVALKIAEIHPDVYVQHVDAVGYGAFTGFLPPEALRAEGIRGALVNHSEHKVRLKELAELIPRARELGLEVLACADTPAEAAALAALSPTSIAVEPPELIGTGISVSKARPEVIEGAVRAVRRIAEIPVLAGAGISSGEDARRAVELGASGVLVASMVMKAKSPREKLRELAEALA